MNIRVGLIGYGGWARTAYMPSLHRDGRAHIVSAAAPSPATQQRIRDELGPAVAVFSGPQALLSGPPVDAVFIAVSEAAHEPAMAAALDAGVAIFYEPPLANRRQNMRPMMDRLLAAPQVTHADLEIGFMPVVGEAARRVAGATLGRVRTARIRLNASWGADPASDLCTMNHLAPWYVDTLNRILGKTPKRILVLDGEGLPGRAQTHSQAHFDYAGVWATFQANLGSVVQLETTIEINGDDGDMVVDIFAGTLRQRTRDEKNWSMDHIPAIEPVAGWPGMHECISAFLDAVSGGPPNTTDARTVTQLHLVGLAAEESKDSGTWAEIKKLDVVLGEA
jgi:predicted dehydrogenase